MQAIAIFILAFTLSIGLAQATPVSTTKVQTSPLKPSIGTNTDGKTTSKQTASSQTVVNKSAANNKVSFTEGKDYKRITTQTVKPSKIVTVTEFFSYGCPWCNHLEPTIESWVKTKPQFVQFERVPVLFEPNWDLYARAFYTAKALGIADKVTPAIFKAIHHDQIQLNSAYTMKRFFKMNFNVDEKKFENIFSYSPSIDLQVARAPKLMQQYQIFAVPTFVVNGQYEVSMQHAAGDSNRLIATLNYLVKKSHQAQATTSQLNKK